MLFDLLRFNREAQSLIGLNGDGPSLGEFLDAGGYSRDFVERLIVPQASAVWSADPSQMWTFPASFLAEFFDNHGMFSQRDRPHWRTIAGGSQRYVEALTAPFADRIRAVHAGALDPPHRRRDRADAGGRRAGALRPGGDRGALRPGAATAGRPEPRPSDEVLGAIPYQPNEAVLHTDVRQLPRRRRAWASWNFHLEAEPTGRTTVTYHMNRLQSLRSRSELCVTLNRTRGDRSREGDRDDPLLAPGLHRGRAWRPSAAGAS